MMQLQKKIARQPLEHCFAYFSCSCILACLASSLTGQVMSDVDFREILIQGQVPAAVADALVSVGRTLQLFAAVSVGVEELPHSARWIDADLLDSEAVVVPALLLLYLKHARAGLLPGSSVAAPRASGSAPAAQAASLTKTFVPKLDATTISTLKTAFVISYPVKPWSLSLFHLCACFRMCTKWLLPTSLLLSRGSSALAPGCTRSTTPFVPPKRLGWSFQTCLGMRLHLGTLQLPALLATSTCNSCAMPHTCRRCALTNVLSCAWQKLVTLLIVASGRHMLRTCRLQIGSFGMRSMLCSKLCTRSALAVLTPSSPWFS